MSLHYDPMFNLTWHDRRGQVFPDFDTLWRFPLAPEHHTPEVVAAVAAKVESVMAARPQIYTALREAGNWPQMRELLEPVIKKAIWNATHGQEKATKSAPAANDETLQVAA